MPEKQAVVQLQKVLHRRSDQRIDELFGGTNKYIRKMKKKKKGSNRSGFVTGEGGNTARLAHSNHMRLDSFYKQL